MYVEKYFFFSNVIKMDFGSAITSFDFSTKFMELLILFVLFCFEANVHQLTP